jgi:excinuclease ABC subunit A
VEEATHPADTSNGSSSDTSIEIVVRGASEHNLRNLDVDIPREKLVVITGLSGSGKSSLAFDTLYAEGQRRYVESLSAHARQYLDQMPRPEVESIDGLSPAISIEQKTVSRNPRSTVGTATEISSYLRLLYARAGEPQCPGCGRPIASQTADQMTERVLSLPEGTRVEVLAPVIRGRRGSYKKDLETFRRRGYVRARIDGVMHDLEDPPELARSKQHDIDVVVDRLAIKPSVRTRLTESIETALGLADGLLQLRISRSSADPGAIDTEPAADEWLFSRDNACAACGISFPELAPRMFSFNSPAGACPECAGLGARHELSPELIVPDAAKPLESAIAPWTTGRLSAYYDAVLASLARHLDVSLDTSWHELPEKARHAILFGLGDDEIEFELPRLSRRGKIQRRIETVRVSWGGVVDELERRDEGREADHSPLDRYRIATPCSSCDGTRLREEARNVRLGGLAIHEVCRLGCTELDSFLESLQLDATRALIAERILGEIRERISFLCEVGLGYLSLDRATATLSGGEAQRIRLATQIGSSLMGVLYILDEPSIGLHPRDNRRLIESLLRLRDMGNSVVVVEHDEDTIRCSDHVIDMGPGAGIHGGEVVAAGRPEELEAEPASLTGDYLAGRRRIASPGERRSPSDRFIELVGCNEHNLKNVALRVPVGLMTVVTGVSGSGKSTIVNDTLHRALAARLHGALDVPGRFEELRGIEHIDRVVGVDQTAIGRSPRSNPCTYTGAFAGIRKLFSQVPDARVRGYEAGRFSFNVKGGRCESCRGDGLLRVEMSFLPDLFVVCEVCNGQRYNRETLQITYKGKNIAQVLDMTVEEAAPFMENVGSVHRPLKALLDVGLGYIHLGQAATTLSGGEAQRIKLARELGKRGTGRTLYVLDEPTTGLHFADVEKLLEMLDRLVELGNTVVIVEHHLDVMKHADHVIDLGPEGGEAGGEIVAAGTPEAVSLVAKSHTGRALAQHLAKI